MTIPVSLAEPGYLVAMLVAVLTGGGLAIREGKRHQFDRAAWVLLVGAVAAASIVGSKLLFFDLSLPAVGKKSNLGGIVAGIVTALLLARTLQFPLRRTLDALTIPTLVGMAIGRVGCFVAGCCRGIESSLPWAVHYHDEPHGVHPVQLYESAGDLLLVTWLVRTTRNATPGHRLRRAVLGYSAMRLALEFLREGRTVTYGLNSVQWSLMLVMAAMGFWWIRERADGEVHYNPHHTRRDPRTDERVAWITIGTSSAVLLALWRVPQLFSRDETVAVFMLAVLLPLAVLLASYSAWRTSWRARLTLPPLGALLLIQVPDSVRTRPRDEVLIGGSVWWHPYSLIIGEEEVPGGTGCAGEPLYRSSELKTRRRATAGTGIIGWRRWFDNERHLTVTGTVLSGTNKTSTPAYSFGTGTPHPLMSEVTPSIGLSAFGAGVAYSGRAADIEGGFLQGTFANRGNASTRTLLNVTTRIGTRGGVYLEAHVTNPEALEAIGDFPYGGLGYTFGLHRPRLMLGAGAGPVVNIQIPGKHIEWGVNYRGRFNTGDSVRQSTMWQIGGAYRWRR